MSKATKALICAVVMVAITGCKPSISESDAIFYRYCTGIYPGAEVAIQRGYLRLRPGTFRQVQATASQAFSAPINWDEESLAIFRREMSRGQNHGGAIQRGDVQRRDLIRLNACVEWAAGL